MKPESIKLLEENIGNMFFGVVLSYIYIYIYLDLCLQARKTKARINKWNYIKLKSLAHKLMAEELSTKWKGILLNQLRSVAQSYPTLQPHGLQHTRLPCPSPASGARSDSCPLSRWCHPTITFSVVRFSSCLQSFPVSEEESVPYIRWPKYWSFSFGISPYNEYLGLISSRINWLDILAI